MTIKSNASKILHKTLFVYTLSLILFTQLPQYAFISFFIGILLVIQYAFFSFLYRKKLLFMNKTLYIYLLFYLFSLASILWATDIMLSLILVMRMTYLLIILITIYNILKRFNITSAIHYGIITGIFLNFIVYFDIISLPIETWTWLRYQGTTGNPNVLAIISIFSIFSSILLMHINNYNTKLKLLHIANIFLSIFLIITTFSKKGIIFGGLLLFLLFIFNKNKLKILFYGISISLLFGIILIQFINIDLIMIKINYGLRRFELFFDGMSKSGITDKSSQERIEFIVNGFNKFMEQPLFGFGIDNFRYYFHFYAHNNYIELLFDVGLIGTMIYYSIYVILLKDTLKIRILFIKYIILSLLFIILIMDIALVSYFYKFLLIYIILISFYIEKYSSINNKELLHDQ